MVLILFLQIWKSYVERQDGSNDQYRKRIPKEELQVIASSDKYKKYLRLLLSLYLYYRALWYVVLKMFLQIQENCVEGQEVSNGLAVRRNPKEVLQVITFFYIFDRYDTWPRSLLNLYLILLICAFR